jgi:hypothetical protein
MNPIHTWLDTAEVRRLADRLIHPVLNPNLSVTDIGFDQGFEGFSGTDPIPAVAPTRSEPSAIQTSAAAANPKPPLAVIRPSPSIKSSATGSYLERIQSFCDGLKREFSASGIFLIDQDGAVVFDESRHGRFHFLAKNLALTSGKSGSLSGNVRLKISAQDFLEAIPLKTTSGSLVLGAIVPAALAPSAVAKIQTDLGELTHGQ